VRDCGEAARGHGGIAVGLLAPHEPAGALAFHAAREALGRHLGVPLVAAVAQVVDAGDVHALLETELVAQCQRGGMPRGSIDLDGHFAARQRHFAILADQRALGA